MFMYSVIYTKEIFFFNSFMFEGIYYVFMGGGFSISPVLTSGSGKDSRFITIILIRVIIILEEEKAEK